MTTTTPCPNCGYERSADPTTPCAECGYSPGAWLSAASQAQLANLRSGLTLVACGLAGVVAIAGAAAAFHWTNPFSLFALCLAPLCAALPGMTLVAGVFAEASRRGWLRRLAAASLIAICSAVAYSVAGFAAYGFERSIGADFYLYAFGLRPLLIYAATALLLAWSVPARRTLADACDATGFPRAAKRLRIAPVACAIVVFVPLLVLGLRNSLDHALFGQIVPPNTRSDARWYETTLALAHAISIGVALIMLVGACVAAILARQRLSHSISRQ